MPRAATRGPLLLCSRCAISSSHWHPGRPRPKPQPNHRLQLTGGCLRRPIRTCNCQRSRPAMIKGKVVIITGASSGIGEATAKLLASKGAKVVLGARREDKLKQIAGAIEKDGGQAVYRELDVTKPSDNEAIVGFANETFGRVDVIFLNA